MKGVHIIIRVFIMLDLGLPSISQDKDNTAVHKISNNEANG